jgi:hypothetical protein
MEIAANVVALWPRWMESAGAMWRMNALVRTRCSQCGTLMRVDLEEIVARHGPGHGLIDRLERCRMVECIGATVYLTARTYGGQWTTLLRDPALLAAFETMAPVRTARG